MACSDVLQWGVFNRETINSTDEFFHSLKKWFNINRYHTKSDTYKAAASAGITIPTEVGLIPMNFDGSYGENHSDNYSEALSEVLFEDAYYKKEFYRDNVEASSVIVNAWKDCQLYETSPLFAQALYQDSAQGEEIEEIVIKVKINYVDPNKPDEVYIDQNAIKAELEHGLPGYELVPFQRTRLSPTQAFPFKIKRNKRLREKGGYFIVRTNHSDNTPSDKYYCEVKLAPIPNFSPIVFHREYDDETKRKILLVSGQKQCSLDLQNLKANNILVNINAEFHVWGAGSGTCDLRLFCDGQLFYQDGVRMLNNNILEKISIPNVAWSPGVTRRVRANIENWSFSHEPQRWYVNIQCEY